MKNLKLQSGLNLTEFEFFNRMVAWLEHHFTGAGHMANIKRLLSKMFNIYENRGKTEAIKYVKRVRRELLRVLENNSFESIISNRGGIEFPKDLKFLKVVSGEKFYPVIRLVLSTLAIFRYLRGDGVPSFSTIRQGSSKAGIPSDVADGTIPFFRSLGLNPKYLGKRSSKLNFKKFKMSVKAGPKGHALWTSYLDLLHMPDSLRESVAYVGGPRLKEDMSNYLVFIPYIEGYFGKRLSKIRTTLRRLSVIRDKEGKNREIAILDYYSQQALRPLHSYLFRLLKRIPQDCTFDHGHSLTELKPTKGSSFHSIDLSSATDRFPIELQQHLLTVMFGKEYSEHWKNIMVGFPFDYQGDSISYARGNPMGAYSSWSAFTLAHHFLMFLACEKTGIRWKDAPYMMLGDDIVIANNALAAEYKELLQRFDIPFSVEKSHQSPYMFEFAKRFVHCGTEISPFPLVGLFENRNNWLLAVGTIFEESHRKRWVHRIDVYQTCLGYLKVLGYNKKYILKHSTNLQVVLSLRKSFAQTQPMAEAILLAAFLKHGKDFVNDLCVYAPWFYESKIMLTAVTEVFKDSFSQITSTRSGKPLGQVAEDLTCAATSLFGVVDDPFLLIRSCPILQVYGEVEEIYLQLLVEPLNRDAAKRRDYKTLFETISIPTGDESFYMRRKDVLQMATSRLASKILSVMDEIKENPSLIAPYGI